MKIAFIGLGNMGGGMAANLVKAGHDVHAFDLSQAALTLAEENGCIACTAVGAAIKDAHAVLSMLPNGPIVAALYQREIFNTAAPDAILIDCSTIDVATARILAREAETRGRSFIDAPVSGGIAAAQAGTLTFMVGGTDVDFARAQPVLSTMGKAVIHAGKSGAGQVAKACNNMLLAITMLGTCEAFTLAEKLGLDPAKFYEIASVSSGQSWSMTSYCPVPGVGPQSPADNGYQGGFATALMVKDLGLAMDGAQSANAATPMGTHAAAIFRAFMDAGHGEQDFSAVIQTLQG